MKFVRTMMILCMAVFTVPFVWGLETGKTTPDFKLTNVDGKSWSLQNQRGKFVVLEWTNPECPFVKKHYDLGNMQALQKEMTEKGVVWVSICSSAKGKQGNYAPAEWKKLIKEKGANPTTVLLDASGKIGKTYGAKTTPHLFVINPEGVLIYQGAIDDTPSTDPADIADAKNHVREALNEALNGKTITIPETKPYGCSVKYE